MKKFRFYLIAAVAIAVLVAVKFILFPSGKEKGGPMKGKPAGVTVEIAAPVVADKGIFLSGTLLAAESVDLQPEVQGKITGIFFTEGQTVAAGQLLLRLNDSELQALLKKATAQEKLAAEKTARLQKLLDVKGVSIEEYESALTQWQSYQAEVETLKASIAKTEIRAPFSGTIGLRYVSEGSFAGPGTKIATLQQLHRLKLEISFPEKYARGVKTGSMLHFTTEGQAGEFAGRVYAIDPLIDPATRSVKLRAWVDNPAGSLRPGSFAHVRLGLDEGSKVLMVPTESVVPDMEGQKVFVVHQGTAESRKVKTGIRTAGKIEITEGIQEGDSVVVKGVMMLKPGMEVRVLKETK